MFATSGKTMPIVGMIVAMVVASTSAASTLATTSATTYAGTNFLAATRAAFGIGESFLFKEALFAGVKNKIFFAVHADKDPIAPFQIGGFGTKSQQTLQGTDKTHNCLLFGRCGSQ